MRFRAFYTLVRDWNVENWNSWFNMRPSGAIRGKWRILDGKEDE
jgi:hypothetical protein